MALIVCCALCNVHTAHCAVNTIQSLNFKHYGIKGKSRENIIKNVFNNCGEIATPPICTKQNENKAIAIGRTHGLHYSGNQLTFIMWSKSIEQYVRMI